MVFALELRLSKTLKGLVYFVLYLYRWAKIPHNCNSKFTSLLRVCDKFNSKAKTLDITINICEFKSFKKILGPF